MSTTFDIRKDWLEQRKAGLGGTDISAVLSLNPWKNPLDVFLSKTGKTERVEPTEAMYWGGKLEPLILEKYALDTGYKVAPSRFVYDLYPTRSVVLDGQTLIEHPEMPFVIGTPDGIACNDSWKVQRGIEIKTAAYKSTDWGKPGTDEVPHHYRLQCAWYMAITGLQSWDIAALFSGNRLEVFTVARDAELEALCLNAAADFWNNNVLNQVMPPVDGSESWKAHLSKIYAIGNQTFIETTDEIETAAEQLRFAQDAKAQAETDEREAKNTLARIIGENKGVRLKVGGSVQWVRPKPSSVTDWEKVAHSLNAAPEVIAEFTRPAEKTAYVRRYEGKQK